MKKSLGMACLLLALSAPAAAQTADEAYDALARQMASPDLAMGGAAAMADAMKPMMAPVFQEAQVSDPSAQDAFMRLFAEAIVAAMEPELYALQREIVSANLSPETAVATAAFFETDAGREYLASMPAMLQQGVAAGQRVGAEATPKAIAALADLLRMEGAAALGDAGAAERLADVLSQAIPQ